MKLAIVGAVTLSVVMLASCKDDTSGDERGSSVTVVLSPTATATQTATTPLPTPPSPSSGSGPQGSVQVGDEILKSEKPIPEIFVSTLETANVPPDSPNVPKPNNPPGPGPAASTAIFKSIDMKVQLSGNSLSESVEISWTAADAGSAYILVVSKGKPSTFSPKNGTNYSVGDQGGELLAFVGKDLTFTLSGTPRITERLHLSLWTQYSDGTYATKADIQTYVPCGLLDGGAWLSIQGDPVYGTKGFCVQKYPAVNMNSRPVSTHTAPLWVDITMAEAKKACESLGKGYRLISNPEWMTIATYAASLSSNWSLGNVGLGSLSRGHSDSSPNEVCPAHAADATAYVDNDCRGTGNGNFRQKRTKNLAENQIIWDLGGNLWQWVDYMNLNDKPLPTGQDNLNEIQATKTTPKSHVIPVNSVQNFWNDRWDDGDGIGGLLLGTNGQGGALVRGGSRADDELAGPFAFNLTYGPDAKQSNIGFRCSYSPSL